VACGSLPAGSDLLPHRHCYISVSLAVSTHGYGIRAFGKVAATTKHRGVIATHTVGIKAIPTAADERTDDTIADSVAHVRDIRNELAHLKPGPTSLLLDQRFQFRMENFLTSVDD